MLNKKDNNDVWLRAAVAGGLWASFEIVAGSFLHNLHVPFAGTMLTAFSVMLLSAFYRYWPVKGLLWRAGLICAVMKSVSPSAVIFGPMTAIFVEGLLMETGIRIFRRNLPGLILGGGMAVLSALVHKAVNLLILYGTDIYKLYLNIFHYAADQFGIDNAKPAPLVSGLIFSYIITGIIAAIAGYHVGKRAAENSREIEIPAANFDRVASTGYLTNPSGKFNLYLLLLHLLSIPLLLLLINSSDIMISFSLVMIYLMYCYLRYRNILNRLRKPLVWIQFIFIFAIAALFGRNLLPGEHTGAREQLLLGLELNMRALTVIVGFSALGRELRNPVILKTMEKPRFRKLYAGISLAFNSLPAMISGMAKPAAFVKNPMRYMTDLLNDANNYYGKVKPDQPKDFPDGIS